MNSDGITTKWLLEIAGWKTFDLGKKLFTQGAASLARYEPPFLSALVQDGRKKFKPRLKVGASATEVLNLCDCPETRQFATICPHVVAAGLQFERLHQFRKDQPSPPEPMPVEKPKRFHSALAYGEINPDFLLEIHLPKELATTKIPDEIFISLRGIRPGEPSLPIASLKSRSNVDFTLQEEDNEIIRWIGSFPQDRTQSRCRIPKTHLPRLLEKLIGHPRVFVEKPVTLCWDRDALELRIEACENGELLVHFKSIPPEKPFLIFQEGSWSSRNQEWHYRSKLPPPWDPLPPSPQRIPRQEVAPFLHVYLPKVQERAKVDWNPKSVEFISLEPIFEVEIEGGLRGLEIRVNANYRNSRRVTLSGWPKEPVEGPQWFPDPEHPLRYGVRPLEREEAVREELMRLGFTPTKTDRTRYRIDGNRESESFLANHLPRWRGMHQVQVGPHLSHVLHEVECIAPEIKIYPFDHEWLSVDVEFRDTSGKHRLTASEVQELLQKGETRRPMKGGGHALVPTELIEDFQEMMRDCAVEMTPQGFRIRKEYAAYLNENLQNNQWGISPQSVWNPPPEIQALATVPVREELTSILRSYQQQGVNWLEYLAINGFGGILADEMGLGKTLQTLAWIESYRRREASFLPFLVICPTSLVFNWREETRRFTPELKPLVIHGPDRESAFSKIKDHPLIITSYALLRRDLERYAGIEFGAVILDEAQHIKNRASQNAKAAKALRAKHRLVLTGTPLENSVLDLWSLFDFLMPTYLGSAKEFKERYEIPISRDGDRHAQARLRQRASPFLLRRTKSEVAKELPDRLEQVLACDLSEEQRQTYQSILEEGRREVESSISKFGEEKSRIAMLTVLTRLRQVCCDIRLIPKLKDRKWASPSGKLDSLHELLEEAMDGGHRVLIFSQFVRLLRLVEEDLKKEKIDYAYLDGESTDREAQVERFQTGTVPLFLISLKAGGVGLNLTAADTVVLLDPWWNPAAEDQATARAHRMGQTRVVTTYKLIAKGTVEEKILELQQKKRSIISNTLTGEEALKSLTMDELQGLLTS